LHGKSVELLQWELGDLKLFLQSVCIGPSFFEEQGMTSFHDSTSTVVSYLKDLGSKSKELEELINQLVSLWETKKQKVMLKNDSSILKCLTFPLAKKAEFEDLYVEVYQNLKHEISEFEMRHVFNLLGILYYVYFEEVKVFE